MREVRVVGVALDTTDQHVILLGPTDGEGEHGPLLPIWVGAGEASSILIGSGGFMAPRPLTHDLIQSMLETLDVSVLRVEITSIDNGTFLAVIHLESTEREHIVDSRPSDAIAIAVRTGSPIFVSEELFDAAAMTDLFDNAVTDAQKIEAELKDFQNFKEFLDTVNPEDFENGKN